MSTKVTALIAMGIAVGLVGCTSMPGTTAPASSSASLSSGAMYSYPSTSNTLVRTPYHSGPYDNTGNGPGEIGLEGGGG